MSWAFLPRGPGPLASILIPVAKEQQGDILEVMDSAWSLAKNKTLLEFVVGTENPAAIEAIESMLKRVSTVKVKVVKETDWQSLADNATGDWLLPFDMEGRFKTGRWDQRLLDFRTKDPWPGIAQICSLRAGKTHFVRKVVDTPLLSSHQYEHLGISLDSGIEVALPDGWDFSLPGNAVDLAERFANAFAATERTDAPLWHGWYCRDSGKGETQAVYVGRDSTAYDVDFKKLGKTWELPGTWIPCASHCGAVAVGRPSVPQGTTVLMGDRPDLDSVWQPAPDGDGWWWFRDDGKEVHPVIVTKGRASLRGLDGLSQLGEHKVLDLQGEWAKVKMTEREGFKRGNGPLASVLLPSRGRPALLRGCVESFYETAIDPAMFEILVKADEDDQPTIDVCNELEAMGKIKLVLSPRGNGYGDLHKYVDALIRGSEGDWLYVFNDDAQMTTPGWDALLSNEFPHNVAATMDVCVLVTPIANRPNSHEFMFVRRKIVEILGHCSLVPQLDTWMFSICVMLQCVNYCAIKVEHKNDGMADDTANQRRAVCDATLYRLTTPPAILARLRDCLTLLTYLETGWWKQR